MLRGGDRKHALKHDAPRGQHYGANPHAHNHMTAELLAGIVTKAGLKLEHSQVIGWGGENGVPDLDRVVLLRRESLG